MRSKFSIGAVLALLMLGACSTGQVLEPVPALPVAMPWTVSAEPSSAASAVVCSAADRLIALQRGGFERFPSLTEIPRYAL